MSTATPSTQAVKQWIDSHAKDNVFIVDSKSSEKYTFNAAYGILIIHGVIDPQSKELSGCHIYATLPEWGNIPLCKEISGDLTKGITCNINLGSVVKGSISLTSSDSQLAWGYRLDVAWVGTLDDKKTLLTIPHSDIRIDNPAVDAPTAGSDDAAQIEQFLKDHLQDGRIVTVSSDDDNKVKFNVNFSGIFQVEGTLDQSDLSVSAVFDIVYPLWGRVPITSFSGQLTTGIENKVNIPIARGFIKPYADNGNVYIEFDLDVKAFGRIQGNSKLFTIPPKK